MIVWKNIYEEILLKTPSHMPETGGIIGGRNGVVTEVIFDNGKVNDGCKCRYTPNVNLMNKCIAEWREHGIDFYGMFHSHFYDVPSLSNGDISYIKMIMNSMPEEVSKLYFPIVVFPKKEIVSYLCIRDRDGIHIKDDSVSISRTQL